MSEALLLAIFAVVIVVCVMIGRRIFNAQKMTPLTSRQEAVARLGLTILAALIAHLIYGPEENGILRFVLAILVNAVLIYGATHFIDRLIDRVGRVAAR